jgi:hypothetical protein
MAVTRHLGRCFTVPFIYSSIAAMAVLIRGRCLPWTRAKLPADAMPCQRAGNLPCSRYSCYCSHFCSRFPLGYSRWSFCPVRWNHTV